MKVVVIGGDGLIGMKLVSMLRRSGLEVMAASPRTGVNTITQEGLAAALSGARVLVDAANSPSCEGEADLEFFATSSRNLLAAESAAGVRHQVALSVVGAERLPDSGYMRAKAEQERLIKASPIPYTILQATLLFEFLGAIVQSGAYGGAIRLSPPLVQPVAADDVASVLAELSVGAPVGGTVEIAGPESFPLDALARHYLLAIGDKRQVIADVHARYFGTAIDDTSLTPLAQARLGSIRFEEWLGHGQ